VKRPTGLRFLFTRLTPKTDVDEHPPTPVPEPEQPVPEPAPPAPEPQPPTPEPGPPTQLWAVPSSELESSPEPPVEPEPAIAYLRPDAEPREWNIWELQRLARESDSHRGAYEELTFLLLELRQFANAEGRLPVGFDPIVRESFGDVLLAAV